MYRIAGSLAGEKLGIFGESSVIRQTKTILVLTIDNLLADLLIH